MSGELTGMWTLDQPIAVTTIARHGDTATATAIKLMWDTQALASARGGDDLNQMSYAVYKHSGASASSVTNSATYLVGVGSYNTHCGNAACGNAAKCCYDITGLVAATEYSIRITARNRGSDAYTAFEGPSVINTFWASAVPGAPDVSANLAPDISTSGKNSRSNNI